MDDLLGIDLIDCAGDNLAAIAPMVIFPASADKRVVTRYGEVTSASFARPGSATYVDDSGEVGQVGVDVPRVGSTGWILEGSATNKVTCAKSNPQDLTNISKSGDAAAVLSVVNDATALAVAGLSAFGPNVYKLDNSAGTANAYATSEGSTGTTNTHSTSCYVRGSGTGFVGLNQDQTVTVLPSVYTIRKSEGLTPSSTAKKWQAYASPGSIVYFTLPQLEEGPVCTSPIPGGTGVITRASEGADTSGNGLSIPLSQAMVDSLKGEMIDWGTAWTYSADSSYYSISGKTITCASGADVIRSASKPGALTLGQVYEVSYTVSGLSGGSMRAFFGASGNAATEGLPVILTDGTYIGRGIATNGTAFGVRFNVGATGSVTINYCRRVLESGQTNTGEGTIIQMVNFPWPSSVVPNSTVLSVGWSSETATRGLHIYRSSGGSFKPARLVDGVNTAEVDTMELAAGWYALISQWSASSAWMRVGIYNPAINVLTWSSYVTYRGFFPIHASNRLRFFYGGGNFPIHVGGLRWLNSIVSDAECVRLSKEMLP